ncbi:MAG: methyltransferase domain-containing protein [Acidobacteria bacterium]|nr:methyltransferase domain-containing protein [Acidobacteriota bacterium]MCW5970280.1 methyltransferase domain-containing protein [Blastocatellales bacterium]
MRACLRGMPGIGYIAADLFSGLADVNLDLTDENEVRNRLGESVYSIILCSHVLEHIDDDPAAMRAIRNLLRKDGRALIQVPLDWSREVTYEDFGITAPEARARAFGQWDHVRIYGRDFMDRLQAAGLEVELVYPRDVCTDEAIARMQLDPQDPIFLCRDSASF